MDGSSQHHPQEIRLEGKLEIRCLLNWGGGGESICEEEEEEKSEVDYKIVNTGKR